ncbi:MAG: DMT family transporter [Allobranchiibius sp.]
MASVSRGRGLVLVCAAGVIWGTIGPVVDLVHERSMLSVLTMSLWRAIVAVVALAVLVIAGRQFDACTALIRAHPARILLMGALTALFQFLFFVAVLAVGVSVATVVALGSAPVFLLVLHGAQRRRMPGSAQLVTVLMGVAGLLLVSLIGGHANGSSPALGVLAALASGAAYALSADVGSSVSQRHNAVPMAATTMVVVAMIVVPAGLVVGLLRGDPLVPTDAATWAGLAYLGAVTMAIAYVLLFAGLRTLPSASATVATLLEPVTAVVIAVLLLGERLTLAGLLGSVLIVAAIASLGLGPQVSQVGHAIRSDRPSGHESDAPEPDGHGSHPHPPYV